MLRFCFLGIAFLSVLNVILAEDYEGTDIAAADEPAHLIPDSKPLHFIDPSAVTHLSIVDVFPTTALAPMDVKPAPKTISNSSCLTLVLADNLKDHITPDNLQPVTVLLQHSLETCPGLKSTFEILQKMMDIKGMSIEEAIDFIQKLTVSQGEESEAHGDEETHEAAEVETEHVEEPEAHVEHKHETPSDAHVPEPSAEHADEHEIHSEHIPEEEHEQPSDVVAHEADETHEAQESHEGHDIRDHDAEHIHEHSEVIDHEAEVPEDPETHDVHDNDETNVEPSEHDNTNPLDVVQSLLEQYPKLSAYLNEDDETHADDTPTDP